MNTYLCKVENSRDQLAKIKTFILCTSYKHRSAFKSYSNNYFAISEKEEIKSEHLLAALYLKFEELYLLSTVSSDVRYSERADI